MSEQDEYDKQANQILGCPTQCHIERSGWHTEDCPNVDGFNVAVASALRTQGELIAALKADLEAERAEVERLKSDFDATVTILNRYATKFEAEQESVAQLKAELGKAEKRGMERVLQILFVSNCPVHTQDTCMRCNVQAIRAAMAQPGPLNVDSREVGKP